MNAAVIRCVRSLKILSHRFQVICMLFEDFSAYSCTEICSTPTPGKVTILLNFFQEKTVLLWTTRFIFIFLTLTGHMSLNNSNYFGYGYIQYRLQLLLFHKSSVVPSCYNMALLKIIVHDLALLYRHTDHAKKTLLTHILNISALLAA